MTTYSNYKPTRLYVKRHTKTGLLYFGKTVNLDIDKYLGSGSKWSNHYKKHGKEFVTTDWVSDWFDDPIEIQEFALAFSELFNIVESSTWANQMLEDGLTGNGSPGRIPSKATRDKISRSNTGKRYSDEVNAKKARHGDKNGMYGVRRFGEDSPHFDKPHSAETKAILSVRALERERLECPHCGKVCDASNAGKYHFDNCVKSPSFDPIKHWEKKMLGRVCRLSDQKELDAGNWAKYLKSLVL